MSKRLVFWIAVVVVVVLGATTWHRFLVVDPQAELSFAKKEQFRNPDRAYERCIEILKSAPDEPAVLMLAADLAERLDQLPAALDHYLHVIALSPQDTETIQRVAKISLKLGRLNEARRAMLSLTLIAPPNTAFQRQYADLLLVLGRRFESLAPLFTLVRSRNFLLDELVMLGSTEELLEDRKVLELALNQETDKAAAMTALGRLEAYSNRNPEAVSLLTKAVEIGIEVPEDAIPALGRALLAEDDVEQLRLWAERDAPKAMEHPDTQFVLAQLSVKAGNLQDAVDHLNKAIQLQPNHRAACQLMGSIFAESGDTEFARLLLARAVMLDETERLLRRLLFKHRDAALMRRAAELMEQLGRPTEAWAWWIALQTYHPQDSSGAAENAARLSERAAAAEYQVERDVVDRLDCRGRILDSKRSPGRPETSPDLQMTTSRIRFEDLAPQLGLTTPYFGGFGSEPRGLWLYQVNGGGVAVTDIDSDGQPDLYFVHGSALPPDGDIRSKNRMYRNREMIRFDDISSISGADFSGPGQGASVGDYDADGFEDLYIANIGANQLLRNNGDGTYSDFTPPAVRQLTNWTTSCLLTDLNADGFDDLYDVNYLAGNEPFVHSCLSGPDRLVRACGPDIFQGEADQCLMNDGAGEFINVTAEAGIQDSGGPGLGILAADFDESGTMDLFVANDMTANWYFVNNGTKNDGIPQFTEEAILRGCALNGVGRAEACMGVAAGDVTEDGHLDLFVTNFLEETNTLYSFSEQGFFEDVTAVSGVAAGSLNMLSFGTQFVDADLDSHLDVVLVNGHVDDYSHLDIPWKMLPASYQNRGSGRFQILPQDSMGGYGAVPRLGRAMARLDWNSDGKDDLIITHLDGPPALLSNCTKTAGNFVSLCLSGTVSNRSGIGTVIRVGFSEKDGQPETERVFQLSAGDGFYCSNERKVTIGLGSAQTIRRITVKWISGGEYQFEDVAPGSTYRIVEGRSKLYRMDESDGAGRE